MAPHHLARSFRLRQPRYPFMNAFMWVTLQVVRSSSTRTPSTLTLMSSPYIFTTRGEVYKIILSKENMDGLTRCCISRFLSTCCIQWSNSLHRSLFAHQEIFMPRKEVLPRKLSGCSCSYDLSQFWFGCRKLQWCSLALSQSWQPQFYWGSLCRLRFTYAAGPHTFVGPGSIPDNWVDVCGFLKPPGSKKFWKVNKHGAFSFPRQALGLRTHDQSCHHETWLHLYFVEWSDQWNHQARHNGNIRLTERPAHAANRAPKRNICEVLRDHSNSS